ncbi:MAG: hypothetical protein K9H64_15520 [Bacteroidales bacterium]|nr:hypothetical protein [Bacteroidales bacterium]MCF8457364.1 hypothetical protein [Bacteroidales bacterium]
MKKENVQYDEFDEEGEEQLAVLIKEAGMDARRKKHIAMTRHIEKLRDAAEEAISRNRSSLPA